MTVDTVDDLLKGIISSLESTITSVKTSKEEGLNDGYPQMIVDLMQKLQVNKLEGVSLLSLKNHTLLSYLNNLVLVILSHLQRLREDEPISIETLKAEAVENSIIQRVSLEKGIKPLEKKLGYQLDKMIRSYNRMLADDEKLESKVEKEQLSGDESSSEEEDEIDELSYKPDVSALASVSKSKNKSEAKNDDTSKEKYKPPKISAMAPPTKEAASEKTAGDGRKLQSMEEYLLENSDLPQMETSVGATIVNNGRGGVKTAHDRQKEKEIQDYEENNFTRLPNTKTKKSFKEKQKEMVNTFGGEDWSMFNNNRNINEGTSRKRKPASAWDRVKKRRS